MFNTVILTVILLVSNCRQKVKPKMADMGPFWTSVSGPYAVTLDVSLRSVSRILISSGRVGAWNWRPEGLHVGHVWLHFFVQWLMAVGLPGIYIDSFVPIEQLYPPLFTLSGAHECLPFEKWCARSNTWKVDYSTFMNCKDWRCLLTL